MLTEERMLFALKKLDQAISRPLKLIIGGGGAMLLAYHFPLATADIDAFPQGWDLDELDVVVKKIAAENSLPGDWLNPYFSTFAHTLPGDYSTRLVAVFNGQFLSAQALGKEDLLIMKCFAHRQKDVGHARALIKAGANVRFVSAHIESLQKKRIPGTEDALDFLDDVVDQLS